jgi:hypothetical protein
MAYFEGDSSSASDLVRGNFLTPALYHLSLWV